MLIEISENTLEVIIKNLRNKGFHTVKERDNVFRIADKLEKCLKENEKNKS